MSSYEHQRLISMASYWFDRFAPKLNGSFRHETQIYKKTKQIWQLILNPSIKFQAPDIFISLLQFELYCLAMIHFLSFIAAIVAGDTDVFIHFYKEKMIILIYESLVAWHVSSASFNNFPLRFLCLISYRLRNGISMSIDNLDLF